MRKKKYIALLVLGITIGLCACGSKSQGTTQESGETQNTETIQNTEETTDLQNTENVAQNEHEGFSETNISLGDLRKEVFALVSSAENSTIDYSKEYGYIEDIGDGRGYTAGIIGFTSGTGDMLDVVSRYTQLKADNALSDYIPALKNVIWTDSHEGLGDAFVEAWKEAATTDEMIQAQNDILNQQYMVPAISYAKEDDLSPLGQYIYYDALVVHGSGDSDDCFEAIRNAALKTCDSPAQGGDEAAYLTAFLDARVVVMKMEEAHSDLSRLDTQRKFLDEGNYSLTLPLSWTMYGDPFTLTEEDIVNLP